MRPIEMERRIRLAINNSLRDGDFITVDKTIKKSGGETIIMDDQFIIVQRVQLVFSTRTPLGNP